MDTQNTPIHVRLWDKHFWTLAISNLLQENKTVVMIAHTLSVIKNADQILVVSGGKVAESGTHEQLLALGGKYSAMWSAEQLFMA